MAAKNDVEIHRKIPPHTNVGSVGVLNRPSCYKLSLFLLVIPSLLEALRFSPANPVPHFRKPPAHSRTHSDTYFRTPCRHSRRCQPAQVRIPPPTTTTSKNARAVTSKERRTTTTTTTNARLSVSKITKVLKSSTSKSQFRRRFQPFSSCSTAHRQSSARRVRYFLGPNSRGSPFGTPSRRNAALCARSRERANDTMCSERLCWEIRAGRMNTIHSLQLHS